MTLVHFKFSDSYRNPTKGSLAFMPHRRHAANETEILPNPFTVSLDGGEARVDLEPNTESWVWIVTEYFGSDSVSRYYTIPEQDGVIDHSELIEISPSSLPAAYNAVEPVWWATMRQYKNAVSDNLLQSGVAIERAETAVEVAETAVEETQHNQSLALAYRNESRKHSYDSRGYRDESREARDKAEEYRDDALYGPNNAADRSEEARDESRIARDESVTAQHASEASRDASQAARDQSQSARDESITARDESRSARDASETARDESVEAQSGSEAAAQRAEDAADRSETQADRSLSEADRSKTEADRAATITNSTVTASTTWRNIYISPDGDDENTGTTKDNPIQSFTQLNELLPDVIRAEDTYYIRPMSGTFTEDLTLQHILSYGNIIIRPFITDDQPVKVHRLIIDSVIGNVLIENLTTTINDNTTPSITINRCPGFIELLNMTTEYGEGETDGGSPTGEAVTGLLADNASNVYVSESNFSGKRYAIRSNRLSRVMSRNNTGTGNHRGLGVRFGGQIMMSGTQPEGTNQPLTHTSGGLIVGEWGGIVAAEQPL